MLTLDVRKRYGDFLLEASVSCRYPVTAVFGPSGSGKTTLLNVIAGLERASGRIQLGDVVLQDTEAGSFLAPERRGVGYVFQDALLFPHLSVRENLGFAERLRSKTSSITMDRVIDLLDLGAIVDRSPRDLSGGERQRVALGRALLSSPDLLLLDEPLASLDIGLKDRIIPYLRYVRDDLKIPMVYVSHSVGEILQLTGQVIVLNKGAVVASGDFFDLAHREDVFPLLGEFGFENVLQVKVVERRPGEGVTVVDYRGQTLKVPHGNSAETDTMFVGIRANDVILANTTPTGMSIRNVLEGTIAEIRDAGGMKMVSVDVGKRLMAEVTGEAVVELGLEVGRPVYCLIKTHSIRVA
jgi:molybdate transport system ATP-binding protein